MKLRTQAFSAILAGVLTVGLGISVVDAQILLLNKDEVKCRETIAKTGGKFIKATFKERAKCADKNLKETGACDFTKRGEKLDKAETKLRDGLQKKCGDPFILDATLNLPKLGFPGKCSDPDASAGFSIDDLKDCMFDSHQALVLQLFDLQYGANGDDAVLDLETQTGDAGLAKDLGKCQKEIGKNGLKLVTTIQKEISKCRNGIQKGKFPDLQQIDCGFSTAFPKPGEKIQKTRTKAIAKITDKCAGLLGSAAMDVCDTGSGPVTDAATAATCIADTHENSTDDQDNSALATPFPADFIDIEYALAAVCGDNILNEPALPGAIVGGNFYLGLPAEECDGIDDDACPGECGGPFSNFPCLCQDIPRERVDEQDNSDLDNGWSGTSHDSTVVLGSGYWSELRDCDGPGGSDPECTVGPSCALAPNGPCFSDANCFGGGNFCRKSTLAVGPHCNEDVQVFCDDAGDCPGAQDFCRKTPHGIPLPLSSGGISVCIVNIFSEDVTGTTNLDDGSFEIRLRQRSLTHLGGGGPGRNHPCPSCGGWCSSSILAERTLCSADSDCPAAVTCVTSPICSSGTNIDKPCRALPPYGNATADFGSPSIDCPPSVGAHISIPNGLDILFNPSTSGTTSNPPDTNCLTFGFNTKKCILGADTGNDCVVDTDCAGAAAGSCAHQCPCPATGGLAAQPNLCNSACRGGANDYMSCGADTDCPGGFCQGASCRAVSGLCRDGANTGSACGADSDCPGGTCGDNDSSDEGFCPTGPLEGKCSTSFFIPCVTDGDCKFTPGLGGGLDCPECLQNDSETCVFTNPDCYPNEGAVRTGSAGVPLRVGVAQYCIPASGSGAVDSVAGLPGPGALSQPAITTPTGFP